MNNTHFLKGTFLKFGGVSLTSSLLDMGLFEVLVLVLRGTSVRHYIILATVLARICSSLYNFAMNKKVVFGNNDRILPAAAKYFSLVLVQMLCSALLVNFLYSLTQLPELAVKIAVDTCLFLISYQIQKRLIFRSKK